MSRLMMTMSICRLLRLVSQGALHASTSDYTTPWVSIRHTGREPVTLILPLDILQYNMILSLLMFIQSKMNTFCRVRTFALDVLQLNAIKLSIVDFCYYYY